MRTCILRCWGILALALSAGIIAAGCNTRADTLKPVRITVARSVSGIPLWGIGPFAEASGFRVEYIPAGTNAEMQRNLQSGVEIGTLGYQSPAVMASGRISKASALAVRPEAM
jgi:hypothetical protein